MSDNKNMILAIVLSLAVLIGWTFVQQRWFPTANPPVTKIENGRQVPVPQPQASPASNAPAAVRDRAVVLRETPRIPIRTPRLAGSITATFLGSSPSRFLRPRLTSLRRRDSGPAGKPLIQRDLYP